MITYIVSCPTHDWAKVHLRLWHMSNISPSPTMFAASDPKHSVRFFRIPFRSSIENPFEPHIIPRGITNHVTRNFHHFPCSHTINILLIRPTVRLVWKKCKDCVWKITKKTTNNFLKLESKLKLLSRKRLVELKEINSWYVYVELTAIWEARESSGRCKMIAF